MRHGVPRGAYTRGELGPAATETPPPTDICTFFKAPSIVTELSDTSTEVDDDSTACAPIHEARRWRDDGWTAQVLKNEDDEGWAVSMTLDGESDPALVGPWTMGRDKKNPKPLDVSAFHTLVKTASEVLRRHEQQRHAMLHKSLAVTDAEGAKITVYLDIVPEEDDPYATLSACDDSGETLGSVRVPPDFKLSAASARRWIDDEYRRPG